MLVFVSCSNNLSDNAISQYQPLKFDGNNFVVDADLRNKQHFDRVEFVLDFYNINYQRISDIKIDFSVPISSELVFNYNNKAKDGDWLKVRGYK